MKIKQIVISVGLAVGVVSPLVTIAVPTFASAAECAGVTTSIIGEEVCGGADNSSDNVQDNAIWKILTWVVNIMVAGVGILAVAGIVYGSILYTTAGGSQEQVKKAMGIFTNTAIGVIAFALMYVLLQWLIPGGVF